MSSGVIDVRDEGVDAYVLNFTDSCCGHAVDDINIIMLALRNSYVQERRARDELDGTVEA